MYLNEARTIIENTGAIQPDTREHQAAEALVVK